MSVEKKTNAMEKKAPSDNKQNSGKCRASKATIAVGDVNAEGPVRITAMGEKSVIDTGDVQSGQSIEFFAGATRKESSRPKSDTSQNGDKEKSSSSDSVFEEPSKRDKPLIPIKIKATGRAIVNVGTITINPFAQPGSNITVVEKNKPDPGPFTFGLRRNYGLFIGRTSQLDNIKINFDNPDVSCQIISGTGGMGKSRLANHYAHETFKEGRYRWIIWLFGGLDEKSTKDNMAAQLIELAKELHIDVEKLQGDSLYRHIFNQLKIKGDGLVVYDDVPNYAVVSPFLPQTTQSKIHVLITSRNSEDCGPEIAIVPLDIFLPDDAKQYIRKVLAEKANEKDVENLASTLGCYPLALTQAMAYIRSTKSTVDTYCENYKSRLSARKVYLQTKVYSGDPYEEERVARERPYESSMYAVIEMSLEQLRIACKSTSEFEQTNTILFAAAYVAPEVAIPKVLLSNWLSNNDEDLQINQALMALGALSLLEDAGENDCYKIHQVVQDVLKLFEEHGQALKRLARWCEIVDHYIGSIDTSSRLRNVEAHNRALYKELEDRRKFSRAVPLLQVSREMHIANASVMQGKQREAGSSYKSILKSLEELSARPEAEGAYQSSLGLAKLATGDAIEAKKILRIKCEQLREAKGESDPEYAMNLKYLGIATFSCGENNEAISLLTRSYKILSEALSVGHPEVGECSYHLGRAQLNNCEYENAIKSFTFALVSIDAMKKHPQTGYCRFYLGEASINLGNQKAAQQYFESALLILQKHLGDDHLDVGECLYHLGGCSLYAGDFLSALEFTGKAFRICQLGLGVDHPKTQECTRLYKQAGQRGLSAIVKEYYGANEFDLSQLPKLVRACAQYGNDSGLTLLIRLKVPIDVPGPTSGQTALHLAVERGFTNCVRLLIEAGADPYHKDLKGQTPISLSENKPELKSLLLRGNFDLKK